MAEEPEKRTPQDEAGEYLKPEELFRKIDKIRKEAPPLQPLWGYFLFKKAITSIVGDPGVCKTSFGYGLSKALCLNRPFLDVAAEEPVNILYMDFESADSLVASRSSLIIGDEEIPNFYIYNRSEYYLPQVAEVTLKFCRSHDINLIFVDNQSMAFNTRDENDNAEAIKQMRFLRSFVDACNVAMVSFHHTSKANLPGTRKGSGAFARARLADICLSLEVPAPDDAPEVVRLEVSKNRMVDEKVLWYFKKEEGKFLFSDPPLNVSGKPTNTLIYKAQRSILSFLVCEQPYSIQFINQTIAQDGMSTDVVDKALRRLMQQGRVRRPKYGFYQKVPFNAPYQRRNEA